MPRHTASFHGHRPITLPATLSVCDGDDDRRCPLVLPLCPAQKKREKHPSHPAPRHQQHHRHLDVPTQRGCCPGLDGDRVWDGRDERWGLIASWPRTLLLPNAPPATSSPLACFPARLLWRWLLQGRSALVLVLQSWLMVDGCCLLGAGGWGSDRPWSSGCRRTGGGRRTARSTELARWPSRSATATATAPTPAPSTPAAVPSPGAQRSPARAGWRRRRPRAHHTRCRRRQLISTTTASPAATSDVAPAPPAAPTAAAAAAPRDRGSVRGLLQPP